MGKSRLLNQETIDNVFKRVILSLPVQELALLSLKRTVILFFSRFLSIYKQRPGEENDRKAFFRAKSFVMNADFDVLRAIKREEFKIQAQATDKQCDLLELVKSHLKPMYAESVQNSSEI